MSAHAGIVARLDERGAWPSEAGRGNARCPSHDDRTPSLSVGQGRNGCAVVTCHAGCETDALMAALDLPMAALYDDWWTRRNGESGRTVETTYVYTDEAGVPLYRIERYRPKAFLPFLPGAAKSGIGKTRRVLYRLPQVIEAVGAGEAVFLVPGEKDADALARAGVVATCHAFGEKSWRDDYAEPLAGAGVVVVVDRDDEGRRWVRQLKPALARVGATVMVVEAKTGKDAYDHLAAGHGVNEFVPWTDDATMESQEKSTEKADDDLREQLTAALRLDALTVTGAEIHGHGPNAVVAIHLSDRTTIDADRFSDLLNTGRLGALVIGATGTPVMFKAVECATVAALTVRLAKRFAAVTATDLAREWGAAFLHAASVIDVAMDDQAARWVAFSRLDEIDPIATARHSARSIAAECLVLRDGRTRARYVHSGWFLAHVRRDVGPIHAGDLVNRMSAAGWQRRGARGRIKATNASDGRTIAHPLYIVPDGWEDQ